MQDESQKPDWQLEWEAAQREVLAGARFPVFAPEGLSLELRGWGGGDGEAVDSVELRHGLDEDRWIEVDSAIGGDEVDLPSAMRDTVDLLEGVAHARVDAPRSPRMISVDGVDLSFAFASAGDRWIAIGAAGTVTITIQACGIPVGDLRLRALADPTRLGEAGIPEYRPSRPARGVLDPRRVADLAEATPLEDLGATLSGFARGAIALLVSDAPEGGWIGGEPRLPADAQWPRGVHGPMTFVAQLSLSDLDPAVWTGPSTGHLHIFCDVEPDSNSIDGPGGCAVLNTPAGVELSARPFPPEFPQSNRIRQQMVKASIGLTLPDADAPLMGPLGLGFRGERQSDFEELWKLSQRLHAEQGWHQRAGQLLGWPAWQHDDTMEYLAARRGGQALDWTLLLQTDALDAELYVVLPTADLAAGRFDRAEATIEHD